jgi:hypothetical protein
MSDQITTKPGRGPGPSIKRPNVYEALKRRGYSKEQAARISNAQAKKDAGTTAGASLSGPGGLLATPGMGRMRKWGNRTKNKACTCGVNIATKEQLAPGITRIRGNLCNVHGRYGPCDAGLSGKKKPKGGKGRAAAKPKPTPEQRAAARADATAKQRQANRDAVKQAMAESDQGLSPSGFDALTSLGAGQEPDERMAQGLIDQGVAERGTDGHLRLTAAGREAINASNRGDAKGAIDAVSRGHDQAQARTERQATAAQRKQEIAQRRADAAAKRAAKKPKGGGGKGKPGSSSSATASTREQQRQQDRQQRQQEHAADRAQRAREHAQDRARRQAEHEADRAARRQPQQQRPPATRVSRTAPAPRSSGAPIDFGYRGQRRGNVGGRTKASDPGDYLIVEDRTKPSTYHLQVKKNGTPDHRLMGAAWAALHGGYRGNTYQGPQKQAAIGKLRKLYKREGMPIPGEKSFTVFKDAAGAYRWVSRTTTAYRDRDGEIITEKALEADAARMTATGQYGPLRYWHIGEPDPFDPVAPWGPGVDIGDCDYSIVIGRTSIESGTFKSAAIGRAFAESADDYETSPGFFHPPDQPNAAGEFSTIRRFERSAVPIKYGRASNLFTGMTVKEHHMDQATYDARVKAFTADMNAKGVPPEVAASALAGMEQADKSAQQQGIAFKSDDAPADPWSAVTAALKAALMPTEKAPPPMDAEDDPALGGDMGVDEAAEGEPPMDAGGDGGQYIGDMSPDEFKALITELLAPVLKMQDMHKSMSDMMGQMKAAYATKDDSRTAEIASLKARLAKLEGDQPAVIVPADVEAALKGAPQPPPDPNAPQIPNDPARPFAQLAAATMPQLYQANPQNGAWNGWAPLKPIEPQP